MIVKVCLGKHILTSYFVFSIYLNRSIKVISILDVYTLNDKVSSKILRVQFNVFIINFIINAKSYFIVDLMK